MSAHVFVDETKVRVFTLVAVQVDNRDVARLRRAMRSLLMPGQERIHFSKERDSRRRSVLSELSDHRLRVMVVTSDSSDSASARRQCLELLLTQLSPSQGTHVVVERDDSAATEDARVMRRALVRLGSQDSVSFELLSARHDPGLWVADAIAWANQRGGDWTRRISMHAIERFEA